MPSRLRGKMQSVKQDLRYAFRMLARTPVVTILIVLSLAIGIGANSAIFSVIHALLLRPLPYPEPERLAAVWLHSPGTLGSPLLAGRDFTESDTAHTQPVAIIN